MTPVTSDFEAEGRSSLPSIQNYEFKIDLPPLYPPPKAHFDLTHPSFSGKIIVMRCAPWPFPDLWSESAHFDDAHPLTWFVYRVTLNFFKPCTFVHFRKVDRQAKDAPTLGTGGRESIEGGCGRLAVTGQKWCWWMRDETSNRALGQCRVGVIPKGLSDPFDAFLGSLTIE